MVAAGKRRSKVDVMTAGSSSDQHEQPADVENDVLMEVDQSGNNSDQDEENDALLRLSNQYRRFSETQANRSSSREESEEYIGDDDDDNDEDETDHDDLMRSVHSHYNRHENDINDNDHNNDSSDNNNDDDNDDDEFDSNDEREHELLEDTLRSFANRISRNNANTSSHSDQQRRNNLAENMARMFPEAMGFFGAGFGGRSDNNITGLVRGLSRRDDPYLVLETLNELSEALLMMNELSAETRLPVAELARALIDILTDPFFENELEIQLVSCRCFYNFLETNNDYVHVSVRYGIIEALQSKLFEISHIDLAEQCLQTLEVISRSCGHKIFEKGCLSSCLQYIDFFTIHAQRKAVLITANSVKHFNETEFHLIEDIFPTLKRVVIEFTDNIEVDTAWLAISRIILNIKNFNNLSKLISNDLITKMVKVISNFDTSLSTNLLILNILKISCYNEQISIQILSENELFNAIFTLLKKFKKSSSENKIVLIGDDTNNGNNTDDKSNTVDIDTLMNVPKDLIISILNLILTLLPSLNNNLNISILKNVNFEKSYSNIKNSYIEFVNQIFELLLNIYSSTVIYEIRLKVLISLIKIVASLDDLNLLNSKFSIINLLASIIIQNKDIVRSEVKDSKPYYSLLGAFLITNMLIQKDPATFINIFEREGLISDTVSILEVLRSTKAEFDEHLLSNDEDKVEDEIEHVDEDEEDEPDYDDEESEENEDDEDHEFDEDEDEDDFYDEREQHEAYNLGNSSAKEDLLPNFKNLSIQEILTNLTKYSTEIEQEYLSKKASNSSKLEHLRVLDELGAILKDSSIIKSYSLSDWNNFWETFKNSLSGKDFTISSFEMIGSGVIQNLIHLFTKEYNYDCIKSFKLTFNDESFKLLIEKLQEALTRSESFEILSCGLKIGENRATSLAKQIKLRLVAESDDDGLFENMSQFIIVVHAIASFSNIDSFIKRRVESPFNNLFAAINQSQFQSPKSTQNEKDWHIEFLIDDEVVDYDTTIFGALFKNEENLVSNEFWNKIHEIKFRKVEGTEPKLSFDDRYPIIKNQGDEELKKLKQPITLDILKLLKLLHELELNSNSFINYKLSAKLNRQLEEPLIVVSGLLPSWSIYITRNFPYLFPLETRIFFLQSTSFGYSRLIQLWNNKSNQDIGGDSNDNDTNNNEKLTLGRPTRHKVRVSRKHLLQSSFKVLDRLGSHPSILEIEFIDEVGTGLGPTLEFYSIVSKLYCEKSLKIWRFNNEDDGNAESENKFISYQTGLFPSPLDENDENYEKRLSYFKYLGKFIARALLDNRILDFQFNYIFFEICLSFIKNNESLKFDYSTGLDRISKIDDNLFKSIKYIESNKNQVENLNLSFEVPGYNNIGLIENGSSIDVTTENVDEYLNYIIDYTVFKGIEKQVASFIDGFSEVFPYSSMLIFSPKELVELFGQQEEDWSYKTILSSIHADHGYSIDSPMVQELIKLMTNFSIQERRLFVQFLTGSPRLPIGGFKNLKPAFTIVLKHSEDGLKPDDYLPSVMTCANYLKLPKYSSPEILQKRLAQAVSEGGGAFLLS